MAWPGDLASLHLGWLAAAAFLAALLETIPALGLLVPGQSTIVGAAFLAGKRGEGLPLLVAATAAGALAGDALGYWLGRRVGLRALHRLPRRLRPRAGQLVLVERLFADHGVKTVLLARFQPVTRCFAPALAGGARMPPPRFFAASAVGAVVAGAALAGGGYLLGLGFARAQEVLGATLAVVGLGCAVGLVLLYLAVRRRHREAGGLVVRPASFPEDAAAMRLLLEAYFAEARGQLGAQPFGAELAALGTDADPVRWLVAERHGRVVGCGGLRDLGGGTWELKRMYLEPQARGAGHGKQLAAALVEEAETLGATRVVLDTTPGMMAAQHVYRHLGFRPCPPYYASPLPEAVFLELRLPIAHA
ncbi:MAG TPA: GNAT family N-acetyltransferase [Candidatus Thermoplasmatota archaeon]|nr:GNAT family N-acetyltransferase [Candidatus Thermoplasmatota archaeon]